MHGKGDVKDEDVKYLNVDFVVYYINGWPRRLLLQSGMLRHGEELMGIIMDVGMMGLNIFGKEWRCRKRITLSIR